MPVSIGAWGPITTITDPEKERGKTFQGENRRAKTKERNQAKGKEKGAPKLWKAEKSRCGNMLKDRRSLPGSVPKT